MTSKILLIDENTTFCAHMKDVFEVHGHEVFEANSSKYGLALAIKEKPQLIILNTDMPVINGEEVLKKLKSTHGISHIPVVVVTSNADQNNVLKFAKLGIKGYFVKPIQEDEISEKVSDILANTPAPQEEKKQPSGRPSNLDSQDEMAEGLFAIEEGFMVLHIPDNLTKRQQESIVRRLQAKTVEMTNSGIRKFILDLKGVTAVNLHLIKTTVATVKNCLASNQLYRIVGNPDLISELHQLAELSNTLFEYSVEEAKESLNIV